MTPTTNKLRIQCFCSSSIWLIFIKRKVLYFNLPDTVVLRIKIWDLGSGAIWPLHPE